MNPSLIREFEAGTLPKAEWTHEAHVFTAWTYLLEATVEATADAAAIAPFARALTRIRSAIQKYNAPHGGRYRETVTVAFMMIVCDRMQRENVSSWDEFKRANADLIGKAPVLERYYSKELLFSEAAADAFVAPDREALPEIEKFRGQNS